MLTLIIVAIFANAFIILRFSPLNFYKLHRYDGQLLYIKATFIGLFSTSFSYLLNSYLGIVNFVFNLFPQPPQNVSFEEKQLSMFFIFIFFTFIVSYLYCQLERCLQWLKAFNKLRGGQKNISYRRMAEILLMYELLEDSPLDKLLFSSYVQAKILLITMSDRKVYIGQVISLAEPKENKGPNQEIVIVPIFSGYRDKDLLTVTLTTIYSEIGEGKEGTRKMDDIYVVLKQENITSACEFVESLFE